MKGGDWTYIGKWLALLFYDCVELVGVSQVGIDEGAVRCAFEQVCEDGVGVFRQV
jgi:hypothetical protein